MRVKRFAANILLLVSLFYISAISAWYISYSSDFYYPLVYYSYGIDDYVASQAAENKKVSPLASAAPSVHMQLFQGLLYGVNHSGSGLAGLKYESGGREIRLLSAGELSQITAVADTLDIYKAFTRLFFFLAVAACVYLAVTRMDVYAWGEFTVWMSAGFVVFVLLAKMAGLGSMLNLIGGAVFPQRNDWFFYDSGSPLMLIMPYPVSFTIFFSVMAVTTLAVWAVYYFLSGFFIRILRLILKK